MGSRPLMPKKFDLPAADIKGRLCDFAGKRGNCTVKLHPECPFGTKFTQNARVVKTYFPHD